MVREQALWERLLPGVAVLRSYERPWLRGDVIAGLTVAAYLVPQVMAYAVIAGVPPVVGLWSCLGPLLVYALIGPSRQLSVGPSSAVALMSAAGVGAMVAQVGSERYVEVTALMALAVALVCGVGYIARLGFLANLLSRPVLVGYLVGLAVLMIASQFGKITGLKIDGGQPLSQTWSLIKQLGSVHVPTVVLSLAVLVSLFVLKWLLPKWPWPLIVLLLSAVVVAVAGLQRYGIEVLGSVPTGLPTPRIPRLDDLSVWTLAPYALGIAMVGYSDVVLTSRAFASKRREDVDASQELLALSLTNLSAGLFQGMAVGASGSRTVIGDTMGSRTQLHSLAALAFVTATLLFAGPVLSSFPGAALGGLVIYAAAQLVDTKEIKRLARFRSSELILSLLTAAAVVGFGVLVGIGLAVVLSLLDLIRRISHPNDGVLGYVPGVAGMHNVDDYPNATQVPGLVVYRYDSPLFFANSEDFLHRALAAVDHARAPVHWFVLNAEANVEVDLTAVDTLDNLRLVLEGRGIAFAMARVKQEIRDQLAATGFPERVGDDRIYATLPTAVAGYAMWHRDTFGQLPPGLPAGLPIR